MCVHNCRYRIIWDRRDNRKSDGTSNHHREDPHQTLDTSVLNDHNRECYQLHAWFGKRDRISRHDEDHRGSVGGGSGCREGVHGSRGVKSSTPPPRSEK